MHNTLTLLPPGYHRFFFLLEPTSLPIYNTHPVLDSQNFSPVGVDLPFELDIL
jgi:hypothetical protein